MTSDKRTAKAIGRIGEDAVAAYLKRRLHRVKARNFTVKGGEIDIIAESFRYIVFVEVKTRNSKTDTEKYGRPADAVDIAKKQCLRYAASRYLALHPTKKKPRFDIAEVCLDVSGKSAKPTVHYIKEAF